MSEVFGWPDGTLHVWTGHHTASGNPVAYVENATLTLQRTRESRPALDGTYRFHVVDRRADLAFTVGYTLGGTLTVLFQAETAVHMKLTHVMPMGSAGVLLYSGVLNSVGIAGAEAGTFTQPVNAVAHIWSAF